MFAGSSQLQIDYYIFLHGLWLLVLAFICLWLRKATLNCVYWIWPAIFCLATAANNWINLFGRTFLDNKIALAGSISAQCAALVAATGTILFFGKHKKLKSLSLLVTPLLIMLLVSASDLLPGLWFLEWKQAYPFSIFLRLATLGLGVCSFYFLARKTSIKALPAGIKPSFLNLLAGLLITSIFGGIVTNLLGDAAGESVKLSLLQRAKTAASAIEYEKILTLTGAGEDVKNPNFLYLQRQLNGFRQANSDCRYTYILGTRRGRTFFYVDVEPVNSDDFIVPGTVYQDAPPGIGAAFASGRPYVVGPYTDKWGTWISGLVPILNPYTGKTVALLGLDIHAEKWFKTIALYRLFGVTLTLLLAMAVVAVVYALHNARELNARMAYTESRYRAFSEKSPNWITLFDNKGQVVYMNETGRKATGVRQEEVNSLNFQTIWPGKCRKLARRAMTQVLQGVWSTFEAELCKNDGSRVSWEVMLNPVIVDSGLVRRILAVATDITERRRAEAAVRESEEKYRTLVENASDAIIIVQDGKIKYVNPRGERMSGYNSSEWYDAPLSEVIHPDEIARILGNKNRLDDGGNSATYETSLKRKTGDILFIEVSVAEISYFGKPANLVFARDITERKACDAYTRILSSAINAAGDQIMIMDSSGIIEFVNAAFERETGYSSNEVIGLHPSVFSADAHAADFYRDILETVRSDSSWHGEIVNKHKDGSTHVEEMTVTAVQNDEGGAEHFIAIKRNITEKKVYEEKLDFLAFHDPLTGLPNRLMFGDKLYAELLNSELNKRELAVMFLDLDRFKIINDTLGHNIGDELLRNVSERMSKVLRDGDIIARMGGDEFTVILKNIKSSDEVVAVAQRVLDALAKPFQIGGHELFISASIGVSIYPADGSDVESLVKNADTAMYRAKELGRNNFQFYAEALHSRAIDKLNLGNSLRKALENGEFLLLYQPQVDIWDLKITASEALLRWAHPELGLIKPSDFISVAEETGIIVPISEWVVKEACRQNKAWQDAGLPKITVAVNISARFFQQSATADFIKKALEETGLEPQWLELEITESALMDKQEIVAAALADLANLGVRVSIDDFGSGYSSLSNLRRFQTSAVKIDRYFIKEITNNSEDSAIAAAVIAMAHSLKREVIAEGVETLEQLELLRSLECDKMQGYFISKPMPPDEFSEKLREKNSSERKAA